MAEGALTLEKLQVLIEAQTKGFRDEVAKVQNQVKKMTDSVNKEVNKIQSAFKNIAKYITFGAITTAIGKFVKDSSTMAMQVEASIQQIKRTMGESSNAFLKWSKDSALAFNMSQSDAMKFGAVFSNLVSTFSTGSQQTLQYTTDLLKASSIIASGTGRTMEDVMERIRSGLLGNTEAIEDLGVNVNVAMLESTESFKRFANGKSWDQLSFQTQQQIRLFAILEQTSSKFGTEVFNNTNSSLQQLVAILKDVALNLGNAFLPVLNVVLPILTNLALGLRTATSYIATFMQALFGSTMQKATNTAIGGTKAQNAYNTALSNTGDTAKKTAKEMNRLLGGFDEINSLSNSGADGGGLPGVDAGGIGSVGPIDVGLSEEPDTSGIAGLAEKVRDFLKPVSEAFENLKRNTKPVIDTISSALVWVYDNALVPLAKWTIGDVLPAFFNVLSGVMKILNPLLQSFKPLALWIWNNFLQPIASWTGGVIVDVLNRLADILSSIGDWMSDNQSIVDAITTSIVLFFAAWKLTELMAFIQMSGGIVGAFKTVTSAIKACTVAKLVDKAETIYLTALYAKDFLMSIINGTVALAKQATQFVINTGLKIADTVAQTAMTVATAAWNIVCGIATGVTWAFGAAIAFLTSPIGLAVIAIAGIIAIGVLLYKHWDEVKAKAVEVWDFIKNKFQDFNNWLGSVFSVDWSNKFGVFGNVLNAFSANAKNIWESIKQTFRGLIDFIGGIFTGDWDRVWRGVLNIFGGIFNGMSAMAKAPLNGVIGLVNGVITGLNKISLPDWVPGKLGGMGINIPKIPYLAKGGIVDSAQMFVAGEAGKEAIMPLENNTGWITQLAEKVASRMPQGTNNDDTKIELVINFGSTNVFRQIITGINNAQRQAGKTLIEV